MCIGLTPILFAGIHFILTHRYQIKKNQGLQPNFLIAIFIFNYLYQITILKNMVEFIACVKIDNNSYLKADMEFICNDEKYNLLVKIHYFSYNYIFTRFSLLPYPHCFIGGFYTLW